MFCILVFALFLSLEKVGGISRNPGKFIHLAVFLSFRIPNPTAQHLGAILHTDSWHKEYDHLYHLLLLFFFAQRFLCSSYLRCFLRQQLRLFRENNALSTALLPRYAANACDYCCPFRLLG